MPLEDNNEEAADEPAPDAPVSPKKPSMRKSATRNLSRRMRYGLEANSSESVAEKKKESTCFACCTAILTLGIRPLLKWIWHAEDTYGPGDPRRILVNRHTERLKKIFLLLGGLFALCEALSLGFMTPHFYYCAPKCKANRYGMRQLSEPAMNADALNQDVSGMKDALENWVCLPDASASFTSNASAPLLASPPPASPAPPKLPDMIDTGLSDSDKQLMHGIRGVYRHQLISFRISVNETGPMPSTEEKWTCRDGSLGFLDIVRAEAAAQGATLTDAQMTAALETQAAEANFLLDLPINPRVIFSIVMLITVVLWFALRSALFNVLKGRRLCKCKCCPKLSKIVQVANKKFLNLLCPLALNMIMVLSNGLLLDDFFDWYAISLDIFDIIMLFASLLFCVVGIVLLIAVLALSIVPALCAACCQLMGVKSCSAVGLLNAVVFFMITFMLYFISILGIVTLCVEAYEGFLDNTLTRIEFWSEFFVKFLMIAPNWKLVHPFFPNITIPIATFRIGKVGFIMIPIALDVLSLVTSILGVATCRGWDKKYGGSIDDLEDDMDDAVFNLEEAEIERDDIAKVVAKMNKATAEHDAMQEKLDEAQAKYDKSKERFDYAKNKLDRRKKGLGKKSSSGSVVAVDKKKGENLDQVDAASVAVDIETAPTAAEPRADDDGAPDEAAPDNEGEAPVVEVTLSAEDEAPAAEAPAAGAA